MAPFDDSPEALNEMFTEITPHQAARLIAEWTDGYLPQDLEPYRESENPPVANGPALEGNGTAATNCPALEAPAAGPLVILGERGDQPRVNGRIKPRLTYAQYNVVKVLLDAGDGGLSKGALEEKSGHTDAVNILKRLCNDLDWKCLIQLGERPGGRYRISS